MSAGSTLRSSSPVIWLANKTGVTENTGAASGKSVSDLNLNVLARHSVLTLLIGTVPLPSMDFGT